MVNVNHMTTFTFGEFTTEQSKSLTDGLTDEQFETLLRMESEWEKTLPNYTLRELIEIYPGSEKAARRGIKVKMKEAQAQLSSLSDFRDTYHNNVINKAHFKEQPRLIKLLNEKIDDYTRTYEREIKRCAFQLNWLDSLGRVSTTSTNVVTTLNITSEQIARAKEVPIDSLVKVNRAHKAICVFHNEKHASMHVYKDHVFCFSCARSGDVIDIYQALNGCDFKTAVRALAP